MECSGIYTHYTAQSRFCNWPTTDLACMDSVLHEVEQFLFPARSWLSFFIPTLLQKQYHLRILHQHFPGKIHLTRNLALSEVLPAISQIDNGFLDPLHE